MARTSPSHGGNRGSTPRRVTKSIKAVEKNYLVIHGIADQILSQAMEYKKKETIKEETLELTKAFPFKINVK